MKPELNPTTQKVLESFFQFKKLNWHQGPIAGLKSSEIFLLFKIKKTAKSEAPGIKISEISRLLKVAPPTITQLINGLETHGFVERSADKEDRRAVRISLTDKGESVIKKASEELFTSFNGLVDYLGEEKSADLADLLSKVYFYFNEVKKINDFK